MRVLEVSIRDHDKDPYPSRKDTRDQRRAVKDWHASQSERTKAYVSITGETLVENFGNRVARPYKAWKPFVEQALRDNGVPFTKLAWSQYAGCKMCPCSPGFVCHGSRGKSIWVKLDASAPKVLEEKLPEVIHRVTQLLADPTMPKVLP